MKVAHVSTFPDLQCGIAYYVTDLIGAMPELEHRRYALHTGRNVTADAVLDADVTRPGDLRRLARAISESDCDVVSLQHEFGIWGGAHGKHIVEFLDELNKPLVSTLHTTFRVNCRPWAQAALLGRLVGRSDCTVVLTPSSRDTLCAALGLRGESVCVVPLGVPDVPFVPPSIPGARSPEGVLPWRLCTIGFLRPDKGYEEILEALASLRRRGFDFRFVLAGSSQPQFHGETRYCQRLEKLAGKLKLGDCIRVDERFLTAGEQIRLIQESHAGVFAYQFTEYASSAAIPLVMAAGRPVICTPFEYARAKKAELGEGVTMAAGFGSKAIEEALEQFFSTGSSCLQRSEDLYARTRPWLWSAMGERYAAALRLAVTKSRPARAGV